MVPGAVPGPRCPQPRAGQRLCLPWVFSLCCSFLSTALRTPLLPPAPLSSQLRAPSCPSHLVEQPVPGHHHQRVPLRQVLLPHLLLRVVGSLCGGKQRELSAVLRASALPAATPGVLIPAPLDPPRRWGSPLVPFTVMPCLNPPRTGAHPRWVRGSEGGQGEGPGRAARGDSPVMKMEGAMSASASMGCTTAWKSSSARPAPLCGFSSTRARQGRGRTP